MFEESIQGKRLRLLARLSCSLVCPPTYWSSPMRTTPNYIEPGLSYWGLPGWNSRRSARYQTIPWCTRSKLPPTSIVCSLLTFGKNPEGAEIIPMIASSYTLAATVMSIVVVVVGMPLGRRNSILLGTVLIFFGGIIQAASYSVAQIIVARVICVSLCPFIDVSRIRN